MVRIHEKPLHPKTKQNVVPTESLNNQQRMKRLFPLVLLLLLPAFCLAQTSESMLKKYSALGLPVICITTVNGEEPTSTNVRHPEGSYVGASITNVVPKEGRIQIYRADTLWYDSGEYQKDVSGMKIKHRGNTSAYSYKNKPFKVTLQKKADLIPKEEGDETDRRSKDWVLLNCSFSIRSHFIHQMGKMIGMEYAPRVEYVNVIFNNNYRGAYILSENITRDKTCRIDVDMDEGYIIELNAYFWNEPLYIRSKYINFMAWTFKYPKPEDILDEQKEDIQSDIERFEDAIVNDYYPEVIDVRSFARWILLHDLLGTYDGAGSNIYVARKNRDASSLMRMPAGWDMDSSMKYPDQWSRTHRESGIFFSKLFANQKCTDFIETYIDEYHRAMQLDVMERMRQLALSFPSSALGQGLIRSYPHHGQRWGWSSSIYESVDIEAQSQFVYDFFVEREPGLASLVSGLADGLTEIKADEHTDARKVIRDGHLYIIKDNETYSVDGFTLSEPSCRR